MEESTLRWPCQSATSEGWRSTQSCLQIYNTRYLTTLRRLTLQSTARLKILTHYNSTSGLNNVTFKDSRRATLSKHNSVLQKIAYLIHNGKMELYDEVNIFDFSHESVILYLPSTEDPKTSRSKPPGSPRPIPAGYLKPKVREVERNLLNFAGSTFSSTFSKRVVMWWETSVDPLPSLYHHGGVG